MVEETNYLVTWIGMAECRIFTGITSVKPKQIYFLFESRDEQWKQLQTEVHTNILKQLGKFYKEEDYLTVSLELVEPNPLDQFKKIFTVLYKIIREIRTKNTHARIYLDTTGAPRAVMQIFTLAAIYLSTKKSPIVLQSIPKKQKSDARIYAATGTDFYRKYVENTNFDKITLPEYRQEQRNDEGGTPIQINLPCNVFNILVPQNEAEYKLLNIFCLLPGPNSDFISTTNLINQIIEEENHLFDTHNQNAKKISIGIQLETLRNLGLAEVNNGRPKTVRKTWEGDLIGEVANIIFKDSPFAKKEEL
ncbi:hypothetical protein [uncultured Methanomethylovorans sp.]|uniref:hypothetical protein n=1 Tax=uncultured Methanomethylovorans sp. TaxID=183759 RepID=UPI00261FA355|nr:hypothetical protein [uncultured Methanomethylovorans sp.]